MTPLRTRRHAIFVAALVLYTLGAATAVATGTPALLAVTTVLIAVAAWGYGPWVAVPVMALGHAASAGALTGMAGPAGRLTLHPAAAVVPIAAMEGLLLVGLSGLRRLELRQVATEAELRRKNAQLEAALAEVRELRGLLPICAWCKSVRDADGLWRRLESYLERHSRATLTHGMCPGCLDRELGRVAGGRSCV